MVGWWLHCPVLRTSSRKQCSAKDVGHWLSPLSSILNSMEVRLRLRNFADLISRHSKAWGLIDDEMAHIQQSASDQWLSSCKSCQLTDDESYAKCFILQQQGLVLRRPRAGLFRTWNC